MASNVDDVATLLEGLGIADNTSGANRQIPGDSGSTPPTVQDPILLLIESARIIASKTDHAHSLADSLSLSSTPHITEVCSLHIIAKEFTEVTRILDDTTKTLRDAAELSIVAYLTSLGRQGGAKLRDGALLQRLLSHFDKEIRNIVRDILGNSSNGNGVLWKSAEECYNQASSDAGTLHSDNYFVEREETSLEWPYDPDYEAEEYYEHEDRLNTDEGYSNAFQYRVEQKREAETREKQSWIDFWVLVLNRCPGGPTLFHAPLSSNVKLFTPASPDIPQYLFRTFDMLSSGRSDDDVVASMVSASGLHEGSRIDLLSLPKLEATNMLYKHLTKLFRDEADLDNLMLWTSSLLYAIQYAIFKRHNSGCRSADIKICAVDTRNFPRGQFAPDMWLLQAYRNTAAHVDGETRKFFRFRLKDERYHNGEYLSQGSVNHAGRSCVFSLEDLEESGLYDLYPELADEEGMKSWTNRVLDLRLVWSIEQPTTHREIELASIMARSCFNRFEILDMMIILLGFKARKISGKCLPKLFGFR